MFAYLFRFTAPKEHFSIVITTRLHLKDKINKITTDNDTKRNYSDYGG